jgi:hypothetical protein
VGQGQQGLPAPHTQVCIMFYCTFMTITVKLAYSSGHSIHINPYTEPTLFQMGENKYYVLFCMVLCIIVHVCYYEKRYLILGKATYFV